MQIVQCDQHRRSDEARRNAVAHEAAAQGKLNRAEWLRRARDHEARGEIDTALNIMHHVREIDGRPGHKH